MIFLQEGFCTYQINGTPCHDKQQEDSGPPECRDGKCIHPPVNGSDLRHVKVLCNGKADGDFCDMPTCRAMDCIRAHCRQGKCVALRGNVRTF